MTTLTSMNESLFEDENLLFKALSDPRQQVMVLQNLKLIRSSLQCQKCSNSMSIESDGTKLNDKYLWRCPCPCRTKKLIRTGSKLFIESGIDIFTTVKLLYRWSRSSYLHKVRKSLSHLICYRSIYKYYARFCAEVAIKWSSDEVNLLGGPGTIVEIDESKFGKMKYNRGARREGTWVFGMVERRLSKETKQIFRLFPVDKRNRATLEAKISSSVFSG